MVGMLAAIAIAFGAVAVIITIASLAIACDPSLSPPWPTSLYDRATYGSTSR